MIVCGDAPDTETGRSLSLHSWAAPITSLNYRARASSRNRAPRSAQSRRICASTSGEGVRVPSSHRCTVRTATPKARARSDCHRGPKSASPVSRRRERESLEESAHLAERCRPISRLYGRLSPSRGRGRSRGRQLSWVSRARLMDKQVVAELRDAQFDRSLRVPAAQPRINSASVIAALMKRPRRRSRGSFNR